MTCSHASLPTLSFFQPGQPGCLCLFISAHNLSQEVTTTQLRDDLMTLLIAGHETTAATLTWATYELTKPENKELLATVEKEIDDVLGDNTSPDIDDVKNMPCVRFAPWGWAVGMVVVSKASHHHLFAARMKPLPSTLCLRQWAGVQVLDVLSCHIPSATMGLACSVWRTAIFDPWGGVGIPVNG